MMGRCAGWIRLDRRAPALLLAMVGALLSTPAQAGPVAVRPQYRIEATVAVDPPQITGSVEILFTNRSSKTLDHVVLFLFGNRFAVPDSDLNDLARSLVYPEHEFDPGSQELLQVLDDGYRTSFGPVADGSGAPNTAVRVEIRPLAPGASRRLHLRFRNQVPRRFGGFGEFEKQLTLLGGWHPYLAALGKDGDWGTESPPPFADFEVLLETAGEVQLVLNGRIADFGRPLYARVASTQFLSLIAAPRLERFDMDGGDTRIVFLRRPKRFDHRVVPGPDDHELVLLAAREIIERTPASVGEVPRLLVIVEAPLRLHLTEQGEGMVVVSDRIFDVFGPLRRFHEAGLAQSIYQESMRMRLAAREPPTDYAWVAEGLGQALARRYMLEIDPERRSLGDWIDMFDFLAAVDRFEKVPKMPFVGTFFERVPQADPLRSRIQTFNAPRPPGGVILAKLHDLIGDPDFDRVVDECLPASLPLRRCAERAAPGRGVATLFVQWVGPYPVLNYWIEEVDFNAREYDYFRTTAKLRRDSSRTIAEPVTVRLRTVGGADVDVHWNSEGDVALISEPTDKRVYQIQIDPERKLIETRRDDNAWLPRMQIVLDSADIEVSSTEFGFAAQLVARIDQDYRRDFAFTGFYTSRGIGFAAGPRLHLGKPIDETLFRHNLHGFYSFTSLDSGFDHRQSPDFETTGKLAGFGLRYDYTNVFFSQNPSLQRQIRFYLDWYDKALGSDFNYMSWGYNAAGSYPVWGHRTILAAQIINGFSHAFGSSVVPNQGLYSLGGARSIRGIDFGDDLGRNIFVLRTELRHLLRTELDWNLLDLLILRRTQLRAFVDSGGVSNSAGRIYDVSDWSVGVGIGIGLFYDAFGFIPATAYIEVATQVDDSDELDDIQVLFGTRQAF
jgi:hypothetical protein